MATQSAKVTLHPKQELAAKREFLEEVFHDVYDHRRRIYRVNFFRGLAFGVGSALGGTIVLAIVVWFLNLFVNFPYIGQLIQQFLEHSVKQ